MEDTSETPNVNPPDDNPTQAAQKNAPLPMQLWSVLVLVAFMLGLGAGYLIWAKPNEARVAEAERRSASAEQKAADIARTATAGSAQNSDTAPQQVKRYDVPVANNPTLGSTSAPITLIEFSDYQCPYCKQWYDQVWPQLKAKYGDKIRFVYRDFPLESIHPQAFPAAEAANCAGEQNKYWDYHNLLFGGNKDLGDATYTDYAQQVGLDMVAFQKCLSEHRYQPAIQDNLNYATGLGVRSTPTFFINGLAVVGAQPFSVFDQIISLELEGKIPK